jgi:hypothetical protein
MERTPWDKKERQQMILKSGIAAGQLDSHEEMKKQPSPPV